MADLAKFEELWPVVLVRAPAQTSFESMTYFCEQQAKYFERRERFALVVDMTAMRGLVEPRTRKLIADWTKAHEGDVRRWIVATAHVVDNAVVRGVITAVHWVVKPASPTAAFATMREGLGYVTEACQRERLPMSPELTRYLRSVA